MVITNAAVWYGACFYSAIVLLKTLLMAGVTTLARMKNKAFANPEDARTVGAEVKTDDLVERIRRCHLNDIENVPAFCILAIAFASTNPDYLNALMHYRIFTVSRLLHSCIYLAAVPQPARVIVFLTGMAVNLSMAVQICIAIGVDGF